MRLSELSTDRTLDILCEITPYVANITTDKEIMKVFAEKMDTKKMTVISVKIISVSRYNEMLSILLKTHRSDIYGILSAVNQKEPEEIASQKLIDTMAQIREVFQDKELLDFFKSFIRTDTIVQSSPCAPSRD